ncbi:hypothetical protein BO99DRAFT_40512 [Aspergillus violaceofuscus CBS 115571]|uniref:Uncharacterized protein n=1 Tax=Aspergillus violaceofuscus (strain CBS 115571) TaxID=1450538 RepID=A0A2V5HD26_ASPV1|nr:hypothetical protein BO99DRAFT_40512 [Aspergillus violaceofuscus CBS 115571]
MEQSISSLSLIVASPAQSARDKLINQSRSTPDHPVTLPPISPSPLLLFPHSSSRSPRMTTLQASQATQLMVSERLVLCSVIHFTCSSGRVSSSSLSDSLAEIFRSLSVLSALSFASPTGLR